MLEPNAPAGSGSPGSPPLIEFEAVSKLYETDAYTIRALDRVDLRIETGEFVAVMGPSGSGKSTLMNIIGCLDRPTSGAYRLEGVEVGEMSDSGRAHIRRAVFGFVFQSYNLIARMPAVKQVELPLLYQNAPNRRQRALEALELVGIADRAWHLPTQLSGGQQQRVAIARSLVVNPRLILADEPTGALDTRTSEEIMTTVRQLADERGITVLLVTHEQDIARYSDRLIRMRDGRIISDLPTSTALAEAPLGPNAGSAAWARSVTGGDANGGT